MYTVCLADHNSLALTSSLPSPTAVPTKLLHRLGRCLTNSLGDASLGYWIYLTMVQDPEYIGAWGYYLAVGAGGCRALIELLEAGKKIAPTRYRRINKMRDYLNSSCIAVNYVQLLLPDNRLAAILPTALILPLTGAFVATQQWLKHPPLQGNEWHQRFLKMGSYAFWGGVEVSEGAGVAYYALLLADKLAIPIPPFLSTLSQITAGVANSGVYYAYQYTKQHTPYACYRPALRFAKALTPSSEIALFIMLLLLPMFKTLDWPNMQQTCVLLTIAVPLFIFELYHLYTKSCSLTLTPPVSITPPEQAPLLASAAGNIPAYRSTPGTAKPNRRGCWNFFKNLLPSRIVHEQLDASASSVNNSPC